MRVYDNKGRLTVDFKLHASKHESGGVDEVSLAASQITSERFGKARLEWTADKLLKGAGAGADPTEIDPYTDANAKAAAVLAGAITNGETKAPTHDAVYDVKVTADAALPAAALTTAIDSSWVTAAIDEHVTITKFGQVSGKGGAFLSHTGNGTAGGKTKIYIDGSLVHTIAGNVAKSVGIIFFVSLKIDVYGEGFSQNYSGATLVGNRG